jgi:multiple sugar transport system permease protein
MAEVEAPAFQAGSLAMEGTHLSRLRPVILAVATLVALVPLLSLVLDSFKQPQAFFGESFFANAWTGQNYSQAFSGQGGTLTALINSLIVASVTTAITVTIGTLAAFGLSRVRYGWTAPVTYVILAVRFYPKITTILPYYVMVRSVGLLFTLPAVIIAHVSITLPLVVLVMITFFQEIPRSLEEAAALDGCSMWGSFRHVVLPLVRPALVTSAVLTAMMSWNEFLIASSVTNQASETLPVQISTFMTDMGTNLGELSAVAVVIVLPIAAFILVTQRFLIRGLTLGAVKE